MDEPPDFNAQLKVLSHAYATQLPEKLNQIEQLWIRFSQNDWDDEDFQILHRMVHNLNGSGKIFGFAKLSDVALNLEESLNQIMQAKVAPSEEQRNHIQVLLGELHHTSNAELLQLAISSE